jgi:hypothetical protein
MFFGNRSRGISGESKSNPGATQRTDGLTIKGDPVSPPQIGRSPKRWPSNLPVKITGPGGQRISGTNTHLSLNSV